MSYESDGSATFTGYQAFDGDLAGRRGNFLLRADGGFEGGQAKTDWAVVPGSGTDALTGLRGTGKSVVGSEPPGSFTLDYELD